MHMQTPPFTGVNASAMPAALKELRKQEKAKIKKKKKKGKQTPVTNQLCLTNKRVRTEITIQNISSVTAS